MNKSDLKVLRGGLLDTAITSRKDFVSAYVTNTRLMGVIGMHMHFKLPDNEVIEDLHQFFYFDAEEYGFETYRSVLGNDPEKIKEVEGSLIGGLGGEKVPLTFEEAKFILHEYVLMNVMCNLPLPEGLPEYRFLLEKDAHLSEPERYILRSKQCVKPESEYELVNYFLMRCFGRDFTAAEYLAVSGLETNLFPEFKPATFLKNNIKEDPEDGCLVSESLIEFDGTYHVIVTSIKTEHMKVLSYERVSAFQISSTEAAMLLARPEYITLYDVTEDLTGFDRNATELTAGAMITKYDSGTLYMMFHPNNKHVNRAEYRLNEDVLGLYFLSDNGQLICASYTIDDVLKLEWDLVRSPYRKRLTPVEKYQFQEAVLYEFIQSGFPFFEEFVEALTMEDK
ncbi:MAG: hypothetical protein IKJ77_04350 [Firmicutes bacterium]|nr:hypothetical protein [Bacillota bacterium]